jgi:undecaprenyl-diphosphatase
LAQEFFFVPLPLDWNLWKKQSFEHASLDDETVFADFDLGYVFLWPFHFYELRRREYTYFKNYFIEFFWREWIDLFKDLVGLKARTGVTWKLLVIGTIPGMLAGLAFEKQVEHLLRNPLLIAATLSLFGMVLWYWDKRGKKDRDISGATPKDALVVGLAQALAIVPGVSRSGITITAALFLGLSRTSAIRFSFLLSAPIIGGAGILEAKHILHAVAAGGPEALSVVFGFCASFLSGLVAIGFLNYLTRSRTFTPFVVYRLALAITIVAAVLVR